MQGIETLSRSYGAQDRRNIDCGTGSDDAQVMTMPAQCAQHFTRVGHLGKALRLRWPWRILERHCEGLGGRLEALRGSCTGKALREPGRATSPAQMEALWRGTGALLHITKPRSRRAPEAPSDAQEPSKRAKDPPRPPKRFQVTPKSPQERPSSAQDAPKRLQVTPKSPQERPRAAQDAPRRLQVMPQSCPEEPKRRLRGSK